MKIQVGRKYVRRGIRAKGAVIAETAASMLILVPVLFLILFAVAQGAQAYAINSVLNQAARQAAREIALKYLDDPGMSNRDSQDQYVYDNIRTAGILVDSGQFDTAEIEGTGDPITCTVTVHYKGGEYGLPPFPQFDVLNLGDAFHLSATSTFKTE
jgi:hypothetical protein